LVSGGAGCVFEGDVFDFTIENITLENTAGAAGHQAVAIRVDGDRAVFRGCRFIGWQDTIFINRGRQYFENCAITGAGDFIFGGATAWFENCDITCAGNGNVTAASTPKETPHGLVFDHCRVAGAKPGIKNSLGRPWRDCASVVYMNCELGDCIIPEGWRQGGAVNPESCARFAEYRNTGPGAATANRVSWSRQLPEAEASALTPPAVLAGADGWNPTPLHAKAGLNHAKPDAIVAADGTGDYKTVQEAIAASPRMSSPASPWTILVKPGAYRERVYIQREKRGVHLVGENAAATVITCNIGARMTGPDGKELGTFRTPVVQIDADDFTMENITVENHGEGHALTIRVDGDRAVFRGCRFVGLSDAVFLNRGRQYFENCFITGAGDFIFGGATAWFENCGINCAASGHITAASTPKESAHGFVFDHCRVTGAKPGVKTYLGRPWRQYASVVFMNSELAACVAPEGWYKWHVDNPAATVRYAEQGNTGPGAALDKRVSWSRSLTPAEAAALTIPAILAGADNWNPAANQSRISECQD